MPSNCGANSERRSKIEPCCRTRAALLALSAAHNLVTADAQIAWREMQEAERTVVVLRSFTTDDFHPRPVHPIHRIPDDAVHRAQAPCRISGNSIGAASAYVNS